MDFQFVANADVYREVVLKRMLAATRSLLVASANLQDMHVETRRGYRSVLTAFRDMADRGVDVRVLHGAVPSERYLRSLKEEGLLLRREHFTMRRCTRVHMKCVVVDGEWVFLGSPNLTGAGMGAKGDTRRNFEIGILTRDASLRRSVEAVFLDVWEGRQCKACGRKRSCPVPLEEPDF